MSVIAVISSCLASNEPSSILSLSFIYSKPLLIDSINQNKLYIFSSIYINGGLLACLNPFYKDTARLARLLSTMLETTWPNEFTTYSKAFKVGYLIIQSDPGPYIGQVIIYKLQSQFHVD